MSENPIPYDIGHVLPSADLRRFEAIERAAQALLTNRYDLGLIQLRSDLMEDLERAMAK